MQFAFKAVNVLRNNHLGSKLNCKTEKAYFGTEMLNWDLS
jgi:hypothetical protein